MRKLRMLDARSFEDQNMLESVGQVILAANDVTDAQVGIISTRCQMISRHSVTAQQSKVLNVRRRLHLLTIYRICEANGLTAFARHAKAQGKCFSGGRAPVALRSRKLPHPGIKQPCSLR